MIVAMATTIGASRRLVDDVCSGEPRRALEAIIERVVVALDQCERPREVAVLAKTLLDLLTAVGKLPAPRRERSLEDELRDRRDARFTARGEVPVKRGGGRRREEFPRQSWKPDKSS
jgi:hypothetical protein